MKNIKYLTNSKLLCQICAITPPSWGKPWQVIPQIRKLWRIIILEQKQLLVNSRWFQRNLGSCFIDISLFTKEDGKRRDDKNLMRLKRRIQTLSRIYVDHANLREYKWSRINFETIMKENDHVTKMCGIHTSLWRNTLMSIMAG